jgi:hypothetical protein
MKLYYSLGQSDFNFRKRRKAIRYLAALSLNNFISNDLTVFLMQSETISVADRCILHVRLKFHLHWNFCQ